MSGIASLNINYFNISCNSLFTAWHIFEIFFNYTGSPI
jgi:hypothetical protein